MNKDWIFTAEEYTCDLRVAAVLVKDNKILVQREKDGNEYALPGGHVKIGWMPIEQIQKVTIYPEFLKGEIYHLEGPMKHFVSRG